MTVENPIIHALDLDDRSDAIARASLLAGGVGMFKVGLELFAYGGPDVVREILHHGDVMLDLKLHDIPTTVGRAVNAIRRHADVGWWSAHRDATFHDPVTRTRTMDGEVIVTRPPTRPDHRVRFVTVHASGGAEMLHKAVEAADGRFGILAVTVLTSMDEQGLRSVGVSGEVWHQVLLLARLALDAGCKGIVCAPGDVASLCEQLDLRRAWRDEGFLFVTPGVRPAGSNVDDQARADTPAAAVRNGADYLVVGRPIGRAPDPRAAADAILAEVRAAREGR